MSEPTSPGEGPAPALLVRRTWVYWACVLTARLAAVTIFPTKVLGREHLAPTGPLVIASNHQSWLDIPLLAAIVRRHVSFVARESLARSRVLAFIMRRCGAVLVRRGEADHAALREMIAHLAVGDSLCLFPEGTRSRDGSLLPFRRGALLAARRGRAPIVPCAIHGSWAAWPVGRRLPRPGRLVIEFGAPVDPRDPEALEKVHAAVAAMLAAR